MINKNVINAIYKKYRKAPATADELNIPLLFEKIHPDHDIMIDGKDLVINSVGAFSPFHRISVDRIHAILEFDRVVAIVLAHSILFLEKDGKGVHVHVKEIKPSILERIKMMFEKHACALELI